MSDDDTGEKREHSGRTVKIDTGYYRVEVYGDPDDSFADVQDAAEDAADRARADVSSLDDRLDDDGGMCR